MENATDCEGGGNEERCARIEVITEDVTAWLGWHEVVNSVLNEVITETLNGMEEYDKFRVNAKAHTEIQKHMSLRQKAAVKWMQQFGGSRAVQAQIQTLVKCWRDKQVLQILAGQENEILRLKTEIVERDAQLYLMSPTSKLTLAAELHLHDVEGKMRPGRGQAQSVHDAAIEGIFAELVEEEAREIVRGAYSDAFGLQDIAEELYTELVAECTEGIDYMASVGLREDVGNEVNDCRESNPNPCADAEWHRVKYCCEP